MASKHLKPEEIREIIVEYWFRVLIKIPFVNDIMMIINKYGVEIEEFDRNISDECLNFDENGKIMTGHITDTKGWKNGFGTIILKPGNIYEWKIKIIKHRAQIMIGIIENDKCLSSEYKDKNRFFFHQRWSMAYYAGNGSAYSGICNSLCDSYGKPMKQDDIITVYVDLERNILRFSQNDKQYKDIIKFIKQDTEYRLIVSFFKNKQKSDQKIEIIEFKQYYE